jgi:tetratricopeptide (TPR) repeat protein
MGYQFTPFLPENWHHFEIDEASANTMIMSRLVVCLLHLGRIGPVNSLIDVLVKRAIHDFDEKEALLEIGRTYHKMEYYNYGMAYMEKLMALELFENYPDTLFLSGTFEQARNNDDVALGLYRRVLEVQPSFVNARINLSRILQKMGQADLALQALMDYDLDLGVQIPVSILVSL